MAKRNPVARFDVKSLIQSLERIIFEQTRKTGQDNRMSFKVALLIAEGLRQLTFTTRKNDYNVNYIKKSQCYNLAGLFLYIIPKLNILFKYILRNLSSEKDPIRFNKMKDLVERLDGFKGITDDDYLNRMIEDGKDDSIEDNYFYKK